MFKRLIAIVVLSALALNACGTPTATPGPLVKIRLPMGYIPNIQFAPFYVAVDKGYFRDAGIQVDFDYSTETDGVALLGANQISFSIASGDQVLLARAQGLPVVYVMAWYQKYPVAVIAKKDSGIASPADLRGRKIGLPGLYGASYIGLRAMLRSAGLQESDVTLDSIGYNQREALVADQEQAVVGYTANEPIQLAADGYDVTTLPVSDYVELASNGILTNEKTIAENPALVRSFVQAALKGLHDTIADPDQAFEISKKYIPNFDQLNATVQKKVLTTSIGDWQAAVLGQSDPQAWQNMQSVLLDMGLYAKPLDLNKAFTNDFVP